MRPIFFIRFNMRRTIKKNMISIKVIKLVERSEGKSSEGPQRKAPSHAPFVAKEKHPSLKGQQVKNTHPYLKILGSSNELKLLVLSQHSEIFKSSRVTIFKNSMKQHRTILKRTNSIAVPYISVNKSSRAKI